MSDQKIPAEVINFIAAYIDSALQLEILLLLHKHADRRWTAAEIDLELRINQEWVAQQLAELSRRDLLLCMAGAVPAYQFAPSDPNLASTISLLAKWHSTHRVAIVTAIYSKSTDTLRTFADAFRLRKGGPNG